MPLLQFFSQSIETNAAMATRQLLHLLRVPVTTSAIKESLEFHPDANSLLSISDSLNKWNISNQAFQLTPEELEELPTPFLAHKKSNGGSFVTVHSVNGQVTYIDEKGKTKSVAKDVFVKDWSGVALLAEKNEYSGQKAYKADRKREVLELMRMPAVALAGLALVVLYAYTKIPQNGLWSFIMLMLKLAGSILACLLLWIEVYKSNPHLQRICSSGKNTNCAAVLNSKASSLFGVISWSEIGFYYFMGSFFYLLLTPAFSFSLFAWVNIIALPYTLFSVFYQWRIVKQWCPLCLAVQTILLLEFVVSYFGYWSSNNWTLHWPTTDLITLSASLLLPVIFWMTTKNVYLAVQDGNQYRKELAQLKYDKQIFNALLQKQKAVTQPVEGLGIVIGNPEAKNTVIKVCNPYCSPCAKAHGAIEEIIKANSDVKVRIIFTATNEQNDVKAPPVKHLMAIAENGDEALTKQALDDWYKAEEKEYDAFAAKYPMNNGLKLQGAKLEAMRKWCDKTGVLFTPTIFVNGYQLPEAYKIDDLKYLL